MKLLLALALTLSPAPELTPATIDAYLEQAMESTGVPGLSVVVTHGDKVVHAAGYGHDSEGRPMTADTPMRVASVSKSFTAMAVMTLVDQGKIKLDEPVAAQLPGFRMADPRAARITVRHLLNQTSGLSDRTVDIASTEEATSPADYTARLADSRLAAEPGTRYEYCNVNYDLAGRLVEVASGRRFGDYLRDRVFGPLGMRSSAISDKVVPVADGYNSLFGAWLPRPELDGFHDESGAGGVITTAADMGKWLVAQSGDGRPLVKRQSLEAMHQPSKLRPYGMGWGIEDDGQLVHSGNLFTYNAVEAVSPRTGYGFAVMTNNATLYDPTYDIMLGLTAMSEGRSPEGPGNERQLFEGVLAALALVAAGLGVLGGLRARRWAAPRSGRPWWRIGLRLLPALVPAAVLAAYPDLVSVLVNGRTVTWAQLTYFPAPLSVAVLVAALAGLGVTAARICVLYKLTRYTNSGGPGR
ncbi:CubicO group peptidase (beta-lactamase class C family) [Nonomuraea thailandensis]|uniref:CubicO group peptidase (Beta-lactamase class C family) n=1 Tax=Nonomuraea thailandensis TaxID=1188745 RepID=A0A9X2K7B7_9ACTN|nr:serine hydrolase domain-containing protein [Nonomuraea thailandensis]MCP2362274.1 CubicO group peptidase (beta-lactamase class C family) [Nonomuraea thailandensis]